MFWDSVILVGYNCAKIWQFYCGSIVFGPYFSYPMPLIWVYMARSITQGHIASSWTTFLKNHFQIWVCPNLASETTVPCIPPPKYGHLPKIDIIFAKLYTTNITESQNILYDITWLTHHFLWHNLTNFLNLKPDLNYAHHISKTTFRSGSAQILHQKPLYTPTKIWSFTQNWRQPLGTPLGIMWSYTPTPVCSFTWN